MVILENIDAPEWADVFTISFESLKGVKTKETISGPLGPCRELYDEIDSLIDDQNEEIKKLKDENRRLTMLLAEIKDEQDHEKDKLIESLESLRESNRNLNQKIANLMEWRDHYKKLYEQLLDEVLNRVNRE